MKKKGSRSIFFVKLTAIVAVFVALIFGVYFALDKLIVPKYFGDYGICNMKDLVSMVATLYNSPDEKDIITNGYTRVEQKEGVDKLINIGFPTNASKTELDYMQIANGVDSSKFVSGDYEFTDREIAGILDLMLSEGMLANKLPNLNYIDTIKINMLELIIEPEVVSESGGVKIYSQDSATVSFTFKFDTSSVRNQMAKAMDTPMFLLNMIVPQTMYITVDYKIEKENGEWDSSESFIGINGRTAEESKILLELLIDFIFPEEDQMSLEKFSHECGNILIQGIALLGNIKLSTTTGSGNSNGVILSI